jgi:uncharacterized protein (DUF3820 family)
MEKSVRKLDDTSPMPFGKYKGTSMSEVPVEYLHWLWHNTNPVGDGVDVFDYIKRSLHCLREENNDLLWSKE